MILFRVVVQWKSEAQRKEEIFHSIGRMKSASHQNQNGTSRLLGKWFASVEKKKEIRSHAANNTQTGWKKNKSDPQWLPRLGAVSFSEIKEERNENFQRKKNPIKRTGIGKWDWSFYRFGFSFCISLPVSRHLNDCGSHFFPFRNEKKQPTTIRRPIDPP